MAAAEYAGSWSQASEITAPAATYGAGTSLTGIWCSSPGNCTAVGQFSPVNYSQAVAATESKGTWSRGVPVSPPADAGSSPAVSGLDAIWCTSAENCTAVGNYRDSSGTFQAMAAVETGGVWAQATKIAAPPGAGVKPDALLVDVWCASAGNCTAVGTYNAYSYYTGQRTMVAVESSGTWGQATEINPPPGAASPSGASLASIWCYSFGNCTAIGAYTDTSNMAQPMAAEETNGVWARATQITARPPNAASVSVHDVWCSSRGNCDAVGGYTDTSGASHPMVAIETNGSWTQAYGVAKPSNATATSGSFGFISCSSAQSCSASGNYQDTSSGQSLEAMAAQTPPPAGPPPHCSSVLPSGTVVGMAATPDGRGYWIASSTGQVSACGDAAVFGNGPAGIAAIASAPNAIGYWIVTATGVVKAYGSAVDEDHVGLPTLDH